MTTQMQKAQETLYGKDGMGVSNFKLFPGSNRDVSAEEVAKQINDVLAESLAGKADIVS